MSILTIRDKEGYKGLSILFFTPGMPFILLSNINTSYGLANSKLKDAVDFILDDTSKVFKLDDRYIVCNKPLSYLLVKYKKPYRLQYPRLPLEVQLIFLSFTTKLIKDFNYYNSVSIRRY